MADKPMLFSAPMVRALLDGRKTQTRRVLKLSGMMPEFCGGRGDIDDPTCWGWEDANQGDWITLEKEPGQRLGWRDWRGAPRVGDRIWVREAFCPRLGYPAPISMPHYRADDDRPEWRRLWKPSIHMPRWASRLNLIVTDVRVQRLQDISEADAKAEGAPAIGADEAPDEDERSHIWGFVNIWDQINGPSAWSANPWVCALTFTVHRCNIDQMPGVRADG